MKEDEDDGDFYGDYSDDLDLRWVFLRHKHNKNY